MKEGGQKGAIIRTSIRSKGAHHRYAHPIQSAEVIMHIVRASLNVTHTLGL